MVMEDIRAGSYLHPPPLLGVVHPAIDVNTHTQSVLLLLEVCVLF